MREIKNENYWIMNGDSCQLTSRIPKESVHLSVFSLPFLDLYTYSDKPEDLGNCRNYEEFFTHFSYILKPLHEVMIPGRIVAIHCMDVPVLKQKEGYIGLKDFSGKIIDSMEDNGFNYHCRITIPKDPLIEAVRTKALGLAHKQVTKDFAMCRVAHPDYLLLFYKGGENPIPIIPKGGKFKTYIPLHEFDKFPVNSEMFTEFWGYDPKSKYSKEDQYSQNVWQRYAASTWPDINYTVTLNYSKAREDKDEKHICPLQLQTISRVINLWSNEGETVFTPFMGIGSEVDQAIENNRYGIGIELKERYYDTSVKNARDAVMKKTQTKLFAEVM
jgi:hypothetical protein